MVTVTFDLARLVWPMIAFVGSYIVASRMDTPGYAAGESPRWLRIVFAGLVAGGVFLVTPAG
jgi:hypothetical protein